MEIISSHWSIENVEDQLIAFAKAQSLPFRNVQFEICNRIFSPVLTDPLGSGDTWLVFNQVKDTYAGLVSKPAGIKVWYWGDVEISYWMTAVGGGNANREAGFCSWDNENLRYHRIIPVCAALNQVEFGGLSDEVPGYSQHRGVFFNDISLGIGGDTLGVITAQATVRFSGIKAIYS